MESIDYQIRIAAFTWVNEQKRIFNNDVLPYNILKTGFLFEGERIPLVSPQGIFKPKRMSYPLSITTAWQGPYDDFIDTSSEINYRYRGTNKYHPDNVGLRKAMENKIPLVYFRGINKGKYFTECPVYVIKDNPAFFYFTLASNDFSVFHTNTLENETFFENKYLITNIRVRLHQRNFRERVLQAYKEQCAFCKLKHSELLDAAHIIPDGDPHSKPIIKNGISLCKLHHAAFDCSMVTINPDYIIEVREDILDELDGPMLQHGLKAIHKSHIILPHNKENWPSKEFLDYRYQLFRQK